ncbi:hypothetical protein ACLK19_11420 [Escherichia coli]
MLLSVPCCLRGEQVAQGIRHLQPVWQAFAEMPPYCWRHRLARGGAGCGGDGVSTGSAWRYRPRPYPAYLMQRC